MPVNFRLAHDKTKNTDDDDNDDDDIDDIPFILILEVHALRALMLCDPHNSAMMG